jgi:hypothetical protein
MGAIFLSASVPVAGRAPFDADAQPLAIQAAVVALATVVLGRRTLVWGGHPAITPMLWAAAQELGVQYRSTVRLFQSRFFQDDFPEENKYFGNVTYVDAVPGDQAASLRLMRDKMLRSEKFEAGVFVGGMEGIFEEHALFAAVDPNAKVVPLAQTGGAARMLSQRVGYRPPATVGPLDFVRLLYQELGVSPREKRRP